MSNGCGRGQVKKVGTEAVKRGRRKGWRDQVEQERAREGRMGLRMEKRGRNGRRRKERGHEGKEGAKDGRWEGEAQERKKVPNEGRDGKGGGGRQGGKKGATWKVNLL